jgi:acetyl esterase
MIHGGGWVVGSPATYDGFCRTLAQASGCVVFSPDYRKAPEWRYPVAAYDAYAALEFAAAHAQAWGADPEAVFVGGNSAGANLAAVCALLARDRSGPLLKGQLLMVPALDPSCASASFEENRQAPILTAATMRWFWEQYLSSPHDADQPYASPLRASLEGLPAALIQTAQYDPLRDEGLAYAQALSSAGVRVRHKVYEGMVHTALGPQAVSDLCAFVHAT